MNFNSLLIGSDKPKELAEFYTRIFGKPGWNDSENNWYGFRIGSGSLMIGPHSEVKGKNQGPQRLIINIETENVKDEFERIKSLGAEVVAEPYEPGGAKGMWLATFADSDGNYFQFATPWKE